MEKGLIRVLGKGSKIRIVPVGDQSKNNLADYLRSFPVKIHVIDQDKCIKCGTCFEVCPPRFRAVKKISGEPVPPPIPEEARRIVRKTKGKEK